MNSHHIILIVTLGSALGCGVVAGVLYAFSAFVMRALGRLPLAAGIAAMQSINVAVINPWFLGVFLGTAMGCGVLIVHDVSHHSPATALLVAGALLYLV